MSYSDFYKQETNSNIIIYDNSSDNQFETIRDRFIQRDNISNIESLIEKSIKDISKQKKCNEHSCEWISCVKDCETTLSYLIKNEMSSTIYTLKCLYKSLLSVDETPKITFKCSNIDELNGMWDNDKK